MSDPTQAPTAHRSGPVARALSWAIKGYQVARAGRPSPCRFTPSCSVYAREALETHGAARGGWLAVRRLARCHPWGGEGWDPVPAASSPTSPAPDGPAPERKVA